MTRNATIDALKGVGIIFVLLGHLAYPEIVINLLYFVHMPLFFFASGYLSKDQSFRTTLEKNKWFLGSYAFYIITCLVYSYITQAYKIADFDTIFRLALFYPAGISNIPYLEIFWFPPALICLKLIDSLVRKIPTGDKLIGSIILYFSLFFISNSFPISDLPFCISQALILSCFYYMGTLVKNGNTIDRSTSIACIIVFLLASLTYNLVYDGSSMKLVNYHILFSSNPLWSFVLALSGIISLYSLVSLIPKWRFLVHLGEYSYFIMGTHLLFFSLAGFMIRRVYTLPSAIEATLIFMSTILIQYALILTYMKFKLFRYPVFSKIIFLR